MKKSIGILTAALLLVLLSGCHSHQWQEATCETARYCVECGEVEGEALGHQCSEATQQTPPTCNVCGKVTGEKLPAEMEVHGITEFMQLGQTYDYTTLTQKSHGKYTTVGALEVVSYDIVESTDKYPAKEGYEWRIVTMKAVFSDKKARDYGISPSYCHEDYYNIKLHDDTSWSDDEYGYHTVLYDNKEYEIFYDFTNEWSSWKNHKVTYTCTFASCVPIGYDGVVVGLINEGVEYPEGGYIYDIYNTTDFCLFRCY